MIVISPQQDTLVRIDTPAASSGVHIWQHVVKTNIGGGKKCVRFVERTTTDDRLRLDDFTAEERSSYWFTKADWARIKAERSPVLIGLTHGNFVETESMSSRGLEHKTKYTVPLRKQRKGAAWKAVLDEQKRQKAAGVNDDEALAQAYIAANMTCVATAHHVGLQDEVAAAQSITIAPKKDAPRREVKRTSLFSFFGVRNKQ